MNNDEILTTFKNLYEITKPEIFTLDEYLELCKKTPLAYASAAERMLKAIGDPKSIDTSKDPRLARLFGNRILKVYSSFSDFYGLEEVIENVVSYFRQSAQGLEESKQLLYLLGPVGGGKSSIIERIKHLMEKVPVYTLGYYDGKGNLQHSPYFISPLSLFNKAGVREKVSKTYKIDIRYINGILGPWESKRIKEFGGDISNFRIVKLYPSRTNQICIADVEPGDENTQDVSALVGKINIRMLEDFDQNDPDAYLFAGGLNKTTQGIMDFREMFKAKIKMLNPLLFAVQEHTYQGTENFGAIPYDGIVMAHSNEAEWDKFRYDKNNEAFLDRICIIKVPYCLRTDEEVKIYKKVVELSDLKDSPVAPGTLEMLAQFSVLSRLNDPKNSKIESKMKVYNGENLKEKDPSAQTYFAYRNDAENRREGFSGISTRWAFKRLSQVFNADPQEVAADPIHLLYVLNQEVQKSDFKEEDENKYKAFINEILTKNYKEFLDKEIRTAFMESYSDYGQNLFDKYIQWAMHWVEDNDYFDQNTGIALSKDALNSELEKVEKAADIVNEKDFRNEVVRYVLRYAKDHEGRNPDWRSYEKLRAVIEKRMFAKTDDLLPIISFTPKGTEEEKKKHNEFIHRMKDRGYTLNQTKRAVDWYIKINKGTS